MEIFEFRNGGTLSTDTLYTLRDGMIVCMYIWWSTTYPHSFAEKELLAAAAAELIMDSITK